MRSLSSQLQLGIEIFLGLGDGFVGDGRVVDLDGQAEVVSRAFRMAWSRVKERSLLAAVVWLRPGKAPKARIRTAAKALRILTVILLEAKVQS